MQKKSLSYVSNNTIQMSVDEVLYNIYRTKGDYREALKHYESYINLQKQINTQQAWKVLLMITTKKPKELPQVLNWLK